MAVATLYNKSTELTCNRSINCALIWGGYLAICAKSPFRPWISALYFNAVVSNEIQSFQIYRNLLKLDKRKLEKFVNLLGFFAEEEENIVWA